MSVWQTPHGASRASTPPRPGPASPTSWTASGCPNSSSTAARILMARHPTPAPAPPSAVQRGLLLRVGEREGGGRPVLLAEVEAQLARRAQALRMVGAERRARLVERQRAEQV